MNIDFKNIEDGSDIKVENIDYQNPYDFNKIHRHSYFEFLLFTKGFGGKQIIDFHEFTISSQSIYLVLPGQVHLMKRLPKENGILIQFSKEFMTKYLSIDKIDYYLKILSISEIKLSAIRYKNILQLYTKMQEVYSQTSKLKKNKLGHLLSLIILELLESNEDNYTVASPDNCAYLFLNAVERHFKEVKTVAEYANIVGLSLNKMTKHVTTHFGKSPLKIIHEQLIVEIKRLLAVEQLSHKEIASLLNFDSQSSYSRFIKKHTQLNPTQLRERMDQIAQQ